MSSFLFFYRSGVVYHLLERGCSFTDMCLDVIFAYQKVRYHEYESERAVDMLKDLIYTSSINAGNDIIQRSPMFTHEKNVTNIDF